MDLNFAINAFKEGRVEGPASEVKKLEGESHFWRAYCYFILVRLWGDLPLLTDEHTNNYFTQQLSRSPVSDVYDLIISDLEIAMEKLPPGPTAVSRPNYDVAKAYLGKVYLTMATAPLNQTEHFRTAADLLWEVIEDGRYQLVEDIHDVFSIQTEPGPEAMLSIVAHEGNNMDYYGYTTMMLHGAWNDYTIEPGWFPRFPDQPRRDAYLEMWSPDGEWFQDLGVRAGLKKYHYWLIEGSNRTYANISLLRYADVLLSYAEAENLASGGPTANSVWAINQIIDRANDYIPNPNHSLAALNMTMEAFDEKVMDERDLELCYEPPYGRWMDLVRKRLLEEKTHPEYLMNVDENDYLFPIPEVDLRQNPNLTQNPGYPSP